MSRRQARCAALQTLFQLDFNNILDKENAINAVLDITKTLKESDSSYMYELINGAIDNKQYIDEKISAVSGDWRLDRMPAVDRNILRIAVYELEFGDENLTPKIIINEAVELAKQFGTDDSGRFINGILGSIVRE
ncbi:transcription antitermination factor NusB [Pectinatus brassicae]|uniref:Transcription antitermination protein NusB n=1 Tax=Pectinatus brassicae TaxID=862415 RepID=A0A840UKY9_9FIRM|nr:transcription antitermination factor NusB [Pectinatus brassicae]MBB5336387.1 N utilization substance protein B [Pectinatus brassicae]